MNKQMSGGVRDFISRGQLITAIDKTIDDIEHGMNMSNEGFTKYTFFDEVRLDPSLLLDRLKYYLTEEGEKKRYYD